MRRVLRGAVSFGGLLLGVSLVLPWQFHNSGYGRFMWVVDAVREGVSAGDRVVFLGAALVLLYPYVWAVTTAVIFFREKWALNKPACWIQIVLHGLAGSVVTTLCVTALILEDSFTPRGAQMAGAIAPTVLVALMIVLTALMSPARRSAAVTIVGAIPFVPLNIVLGIKVLQDLGPGWGFFLGAAGALVVFIGAAGIVVVGLTGQKRK